MTMAVQRRARTVSPSTSAAPAVANSGMVNESAVTSASGMMMTAQKPQIMPTVPKAPRIA